MGMNENEIPVNKHAIRHGEPAAGWIIIFAARFEVSNKLFATLEQAREHCKQIHPSHEPVIKALRWHQPDRE
jgi:sensor histidine kinase regulating citrate/malate metabolism